MKFRKKKPISGDISLNITAMADIFTILLVFLLKSFSVGVLDISPSSGLTLPQAQADQQQTEALKVEISQTAVLIESTPAAKLDGFKFHASDLQSNGTSKLLDSLLKKERQRQLLIAKNNSEVKVDARIIVIADQKVPYSTIKTVLASAAVNGFTDFKLAVIKEGS